MHYLVSYDIANPRRRRRVAQLLETYGDRLHESAFGLNLRPAQLGRLCRVLPRLIDAQQDRVAVHRICRRDHPDIVHLGLSAWPTAGHAVIV